MKRTILLLLAGLLLTSAVQAKILAFGVTAGLEMPKIKTSDLEGSVNASTGFHLGVLGQINVPVVGITVQPELLYSHNWVKVEDSPGENSSKGMNYFEIPVHIMWGIRIAKIRPVIFASPFVSGTVNDLKMWATGGTQDESLKKFNYGVGLGGGIELFDHFQLLVRHNWGFNDLSAPGKFKVSGYSASVGYIF